MKGAQLGKLLLNAGQAGVGHLDRETLEVGIEGEPRLSAADANGVVRELPHFGRRSVRVQPENVDLPGFSHHIDARRAGSLFGSGGACKENRCGAGNRECFKYTQGHKIPLA
jgi:hypothetical protein